MYNTDLPKREELPSSKQLLRSTLIAIGVASVLLITVILPAEYGVDPTKIGRVLGLTKMGEIKTQLAEEAAQETVQEATVIAVVEPKEAPQAETVEPVESAIIEETTSAPQWSDEVSVTIEPDKAAEVKLIMNKGGVATYEWTVSEGHLNSDLHGDETSGDFVSYRKGRKEEGDAGEFTAKFDGSHGWFWRNRSDLTVTVTLKVRGDYSEVKRVL